jgi:primosomal protein N'
VVVDRSGRLGALSYLVPEHLEVAVGDAVKVPFGTRDAVGMVVGGGNVARATREICSVYGPRASAEMVEIARRIAEDHFGDLAGIASRLAPPDGKGAAAHDAGPVALAEGVSVAVPDLPSRQLLVCAPPVEPAFVTASVAARLAERYPVLVLCPTRAAVAEVLGAFESGAAALESTKGAEATSWAGWRSGSVRIGVGTRAAALWSSQEPCAVVVHDESHPGHREAAQPHTHAREIATVRTRVQHTPLVLCASSAPSVESLGCSVKLAVVGRSVDWPSIQAIDRSELPPAERAVPGKLKSIVRGALAGGGSVVVVCDRSRPPWRCERCGEVAELTGAGPTTTATGPECTRCRGCSYRRPGWDRERAIDQFGEQIEVVDHLSLGGLRDRGLVVVPDADRVLRSARLDPFVPATRLVVDAARAAGPHGKVVVVVNSIDDPIWDATLKRRDLNDAARLSWETAERAGLPPFGRMVWVRTRRARPPSTDGWPGRVLGPVHKGGEWEVAVNLPHGRLNDMATHVDRLRRGGKVRIWVD